MSISAQIKLIVVLAILSLLASIGVLFLPVEEGLNLGTRADVSMALSAIFALLIGIIAILLVATVEKAEFRAQERLKDDLTTLTAVLHSILMKTSVGFGNRAAGHQPQVSFEHERKEIGRIVGSSTGFALVCWVGKKSEEAGQNPEAWRMLMGGLVDLLNTEFLGPAQLPPRGYLKDVVFPLNALLSSLTDKDIREMSRFLHDLTDAMPFYRRSLENNVYIQALEQVAARPPGPSTSPGPSNGGDGAGAP